MNYLLPAAILLFCVPVVFLPATQIRWVFSVTLAAFVLGILGCTWPYLMPQNFLIDHPWAVDTPLHPTLSTFCGGVGFIFFTGLALALASRSVLLYLKLVKPR